MNTYKRVSKQRTSTPFRMNTYEKHRGVGSALLSAPLHPSLGTSLAASGRSDHEDHSLVSPEHRKKIEQLLPRRVHLIQQAHSILGFRVHHNLRAPLDPLPQQPAPCCAWRNSHARIIPNPFHFARVR